MTAPNPDAELDEALGIAELPRATVTDEHRHRALDLAVVCGVHEQSTAFDCLAQGIADAEQRGAARVLAERAAAGAL